MQLIVTDREGIEQGVRVRSSYVVISIHDPDKERPRVRKQSGLRGVLYVAFHDAEPLADAVLPKHVTLMTADHAQRIRQFVQQYREAVGTIVVHCEQGASRSPAVAAALARWLGEDAQPFHREYQPNQHVYRLLLECCNSSTQAAEA